MSRSRFSGTAIRLQRHVLIGNPVDFQSGLATGDKKIGFRASCRNAAATANFA
jgi:hypothetical protein